MYTVDYLNKCHRECEKANKALLTTETVTLRFPLRHNISLTYDEQKRLKVLIHWALDVAKSDNLIEGDDAFLISALQPLSIDERIPYDV